MPSEEKCEQVYEIAKRSEYILSVGSGTLNDMAKSFLLVKYSLWCLGDGGKYGWILLERGGVDALWV